MVNTIVLFILILILLGSILKKENFKIIKYDPKNMDRYLENDLSNEEVRKTALRDFNTENINYYKGPYNCLNFQDLLNVDNWFI